MEIKVGTKFRSAYADSIPEWEVSDVHDKDHFTCKVVSDEWNGVFRLFFGDEIRAALRSSRYYEEQRNEHDSWWGSRKVGEIIHYRCHIGQYVRGEAVEYVDNQRKMKITGLVGNWPKQELPHWDVCGMLRMGHYARQVQSGEVICPNVSNMYEAHERDNEPDPRMMDRLSMDPGLCSEDQLACRRLNSKRLMILDMLQEFPKQDKNGNYATGLKQMLSRVATQFPIK